MEAKASDESHSKNECKAGHKCGDIIRIKKKYRHERCRKSLDHILQVLKDHNYGEANANITKLFQEIEKIKKEEAKDISKNYPFIILEGLCCPEKTIVAKHLAKKLNGEYLCNVPSKNIAALEKDLHETFHIPFGYLINYIKAVEARKLLKDKPVIMDSFWHSTTAYFLAEKKKNLFQYFKSAEIPAKGDFAYEWPKDLIKPDLVLFLDVDSSHLQKQSVKTENKKEQGIREMEHSDEFVTYIRQAFDNMGNPNILKVNGNVDIDNILKEIDLHIQHLL